MNQYVFCNDNPVNFRDPMGLCEDGEAFLQEYLNRLMKNPFNPIDVLGPNLLADPNIDVGANYPLRKYEFRGKVYTASEMGNIAAGYATTYAWGAPLAWDALITAEGAAFLDPPNKGRIEDARGSFKHNAIGMREAFKDHPVVSTLNSVPGSLSPVVNWLLY